MVSGCRTSSRQSRDRPSCTKTCDINGTIDCHSEACDQEILPAVSRTKSKRSATTAFLTSDEKVADWLAKSPAIPWDTDLAPLKEPTKSQQCKKLRTGRTFETQQLSESIQPDVWIPLLKDEDRTRVYKYQTQDAIIVEAYEALNKRLASFSCFVEPVQVCQPDSMTLLEKSSLSKLLAYIASIVDEGGQQVLRKPHLDEKPWRQHLIQCLVGRLLQDQVISELLFGVDEKTWKELHEQEIELRDTDGFERTKARAEKVKNIVASEYYEKHLSSYELGVALRIYCFIKPLLIAPRKTAWSSRKAKSTIQDLWELVKIARFINHRIRSDPDTVYYHVPLTLGEAWNPESHQCVNTEMMKSASELSGNRGHNKLYPSVVIIGLEGVTAYRRGGWDEKFAEVGFRTRALVKGSIALDMGCKHDPAA